MLALLDFEIAYQKRELNLQELKSKFNEAKVSIDDGSCSTDMIIKVETE